LVDESIPPGKRRGAASLRPYRNWNDLKFQQKRENVRYPLFDAGLPHVEARYIVSLHGIHWVVIQDCLLTSVVARRAVPLRVNQEFSSLFDFEAS